MIIKGRFLILHPCQEKQFELSILFKKASKRTTRIQGQKSCEADKRSQGHPGKYQ